LGLHPREKAFARCGTYAIEISRDNFHDKTRLKKLALSQIYENLSDARYNSPFASLFHIIISELIVGNLQNEFIRFSVDSGVLRFGEFITKAGRKSPYFFNAGLFNDGASLGKLADFYAQALLNSGIAFDMLFGPAYKGITLVAATAVALANHGRNVPFAYNRKEAKDHGEGGNIVGAPIKGRVVIIDDVISAGTSVNESVDIIRAAGATPCAVLIALDRMERGGKDGVLSDRSAVEEVEIAHQMPVISIGNLNDLLCFLSYSNVDPALLQYKDAVAAYREKYGIRV